MWYWPPLLNIGAIANQNSYTENRKAFHITGLNCTGTESSIFDCSYTNVSSSNCVIYEDASVQCLPSNITDNCTAGSVRLVNGQSTSEGRVELCYEGQWGSICSSSWDNNDAKVICRQLNYTTVGQYWSAITIMCYYLFNDRCFDF